MYKALSILIFFILSMSAAVAAQAITIDTVTVGNPGNAPDTRYGQSVGAVPYVYSIGKYEITAGQYTAFLNAVAKTDTCGLYSSIMYSDSALSCRIRQLGSPGSYTYIVDTNGDGIEDPDWVNRPVNWVSWADAARFCNWLANGQPNAGVEDFTTTEDGSYYLNGATTSQVLSSVTRKPNATWVIPSENEWYKAAYHKNDGITGHYWDCATGTNYPPSNALISPDPGNNANFVQNGKPTIGRPYFRTPVGAFTNSESPYGTFDQGGNVTEWTERAYYDTYLNCGVAIMRGGDFDGTVDSIRASSWGGTDLTYKMGNVGFRVAYIPEPSSLAAVLTVTVAFLFLWRRAR
jgi:formylglycine-generating enzyme